MLRRDGWVGLLLLSGLVTGCGKVVEKPKPPLDLVLTSKPTEDEVTDYEEFIGHTDAVFSVEVRARVTGYLDQVAFKDGDEVNKGDLLFQIDARPYQATFDQTAATLEQGRARLTTATNNHLRAEALFRRNAIGREEYDRIQGDFAEATANIGVAKAALDSAQLNLDFTHVTAPISGRLSRRMVDPGNLVRADDTLLTTIVSFDPMYVYFDVDERTMLKLRRLIAQGKIKSRQEAEIPIFVGLSDDGDKFPHRGTINFSDNKVISSTGTLQVRGAIENPKPRILSPGLYVRVRLPVGASHKSLLIPERAIVADQGKKRVFVVRKNEEIIEKDAQGKPKPARRGDVVHSLDIGVGSLNNGLRVVESGAITKDDLIVVSGLQRVRDGKEVRDEDETVFAQRMKKLDEKQAAEAAASRQQVSEGM